MNDVTLLRNPHSTRNRRSRPARQAPAGVRVIDCARLEELSPRLREAHEAGTDVLLIDGGDGTVREVLTRLPDIWGARMPAIGIVPRGNTNLIARQGGAVTAPDALAEIVRRRAAGLALVRRRLAMLKVEWPDLQRPPLRGFMLGWGLYVDATRIARAELGVVGPAQIPFAIAKMLRRMMFGTEGRRMRQGIAAAITADGAALADGRRLIGLATSLGRRLLVGLNPFWGEGTGPIRWLDVQAPGRRLLAALPFALTGRPRRWMRRAGYHSGRARRFELALDTEFIMDGDFFPPPIGGPLTITAEEQITFISL